MSNKKQTAVDFAFEKLANQGLLVTREYKNLVAYHQAKEMEKEQNDKLRNENDRLQKALDFNVKENVNILRQFSEKIAENEKLRECLNEFVTLHDEAELKPFFYKVYNKAQTLLNK